MAYTCPRCARTSHHPEDARQGYCGACHDWTGPGVPGEGTAREYQCESCGLRMAVPPEHVGRTWCPCGSARAMAPAPWLVQGQAVVRPADVQVVTDPSVPSGHVMLVNSRGLWQYLAHTGPVPGAGSADVAAVSRFIRDAYEAGPLLPEFQAAAERVSEAMSRHWRGFTSLAELRLEVSGHLDQAMTDLITGSQRSAPTDSGDHSYVPPEDGGIPWANPMQWSPGDVEL